MSEATTAPREGGNDGVCGLYDWRSSFTPAGNGYRILSFERQHAGEINDHLDGASTTGGARRDYLVRSGGLFQGTEVAG